VKKRRKEVAGSSGIRKVYKISLLFFASIVNEKREQKRNFFAAALKACPGRGEAV